MTNKTRTASPVKSQKGLERKYRRELNKLGRALIKSVNTELLPFLKAEQSTYVSDGISASLALIFEKLNSRFSGTAIAGFSQNVASTMVNTVGISNKNKFDKTVKAATGVDLGAVVTTEGLNEFVDLSINKNVSLIKSLPEEYLKQVEVIVNNGVTSGTRFSTIAKEISGAVGSANSKLAGRIKTIAMNEVQTINAQITKRRTEALGVTDGIWRTSEDEKVRKCHDVRNGKKFSLNKGLFSSCDGKFLFPGITDINCRCSFSPIIEVT